MADHYAVTDNAEPLARLRDIAEHIDRLAEALDDYCYDGTANELGPQIVWELHATAARARTR